MTCLADPMLPAPYRVLRVRRETPSTFTLHLEPAEGQAAMGFRPGQFNMVYLFGVGEVALSISGDPAQPALLQHTVRAVGTVTNGLAKLRKGAVLGVRGPFGSAWPMEAAEGKTLLLLAGGTGLAPLRSVVYRFLADPGRFEQLVLLYGARTPQDILYRKEQAVWQKKRRLEVHQAVSIARADWSGKVMPITELLRQVPFDPQNTIAFTCGPEAMMRFAAEVLRERDVPLERVYISMERNMKCAIAFCGHCQLGPVFLCREGPVFPYPRLQRWLGIREV